MTDIQLKEETVLFHKQLYHESELLLARCYNFEYDELTGVISAHLRYTAKQALFYFIELAFKNFWESPLQEGRRNDFLKKIWRWKKKEIMMMPPRAGRKKTVYMYMIN